MLWPSSPRSTWLRFPKQWLWSGIRVEAGLFRLEGDQDIPHTQNQLAAAARRQHIEGSVRLHILIGKDGRIQGLVLNGAPAAVLARAAMDAVRNWQYSPALLNGVPLPVETQITVTFPLN